MFAFLSATHCSEARRFGPTSFCLTLALLLLGLSTGGCSSTSPSANAVPDYDTGPRLQGSLSDVVARISYPELARQHGVAGAVTIDFMIDVDGSIFDARVVQSPDWDDAPVAAVAALKREALRVANTLTFTPAMKDGEPIQIGMLFPLVFELD